MKVYSLSDRPPMPSGFEKHQGKTVEQLGETNGNTMLLLLLMKKGCWEIGDDVRDKFFKSNPHLLRTKKKVY